MNLTIHSHQTEQVYTYNIGSLISSCLIFTDEMDFDVNAIIVEFPPDVASVAANISIRDDEVNEAMNQTFIVYLEVEDAERENLITLSHRDSTCTIVDNDGMLYLVITWSTNRLIPEWGHRNEH